MDMNYRGGMWEGGGGQDGVERRGGNGTTVIMPETMPGVSAALCWKGQVP